MNVFIQQYPEGHQRTLTVISARWANQEETSVIVLTEEHGEVGLSVEDGNVFTQVVEILNVDPIVKFNAPPETFQPGQQN